MRLMAVMAHPDDAEIWCGGTLVLHAEKGDPVRLCILSYAEESIRGREAREGAKRMGCEVKFVGLEDAAIRDTDEAADKLRQCLESFRPDTIITHWYDDMHPDHEAAFYVLRRALLRHYLANPSHRVEQFPRIFCCDTYKSMGLHGPFTPDCYVDVTRIWKKKVAAVKAHQSEPIQFYLPMIEEQCLSHGKVAETKRAEGFVYMPLFGRSDDGPPL
jgi:LmbE family N-acetylglucosaminyl deacetylase